MESGKVTVAEITARGQLTIPKRIRDMGHLGEGQTVSIIPLGDSLLITPRRLALDDAGRQIKQVLKASGRSLDELLSGLGEERGSLYRDSYRKKG